MSNHTIAAGVPTVHRWTAAEYTKMIDSGIFTPDDRIELIEGEIIEMNPQKSPHATGVTLVLEALQAVFRPDYTIRVQLPLELNDTSQPEPDIAVVDGKARDFLEHHPTTARLVVEVSDATLAYDREQKLSLYAKAGIEEYWIVNLVDGRLEVYREPAPMPNLPFGFGYKQIRYCVAGEAVSPIAHPAVEVEVADLVP